MIELNDSRYYSMLPSGGLTLGPFTYLDYKDLPSEPQLNAWVNEERARKEADVNWMAHGEFYRQTQPMYSKVRFTQIFCLLNDALVGHLFLAKINPPWPGMEGDKDYITGSAPGSLAFDFTKEWAEGLTRILLWLAYNGFVEKIGAKFVQVKSGGQWVSGSNWCDLHSPRFMPVTDYALFTNATDDMRVTLRIIDATQVPVYTDAQITAFFDKWTWPARPSRAGH